MTQRTSSGPDALARRIPLAVNRSATATIAKQPIMVLVMIRLAERMNIFSSLWCLSLNARIGGVFREKEVDLKDLSRANGN
jgi:hypothetical protein